MKNGIIDGIYYENDNPKHAGVIKIDGELYYAGSDGKIATGYKVVHSSMSNDLLKHGTYKFAEDGKLIKGSYQKPKKVKRHKKKRKKPEKRRKIVLTKKDVRNIILSVALIVICVGFILFMKALDKGPAVDLNETDISAVKKISLPDFNEEVYLCSPSMERYYKGEGSLAQAVNSGMDAYSAFEFRYDLTGTLGGILELDGKKYNMSASYSSINVDNLFTGKTYNYIVTVYEKDGDEIKETVYDGSFTTADTNRFVYIPGLQNTRDIGGYDTIYGKKVKEGILIRGTELDGLVESKYFLTDKDAAAEFGFVYDMDLRSPDIFYGDYASRFGDNVKHKFYNASQYGAVFSKSMYTKLKDIFTDLADSKNYPMYMHCTYGADRTGTVVFFLQGILGVSKDDMELEYKLTGFTYPSYESATNLNGIIGGLDGIKGDTINEKIENFLVDTVGITHEQIESIRNIFLED